MYVSDIWGPRAIFTFIVMKFDQKRTCERPKLVCVAPRFNNAPWKWVDASFAPESSHLPESMKSSTNFDWIVKLGLNYIRTTHEFPRLTPHKSIVKWCLKLPLHLYHFFIAVMKKVLRTLWKSLSKPIYEHWSLGTKPILNIFNPDTFLFDSWPLLKP